MLKFKCPLIAVSDLEKSVRFYEEVMGDRVTMDFGENVVFEGGFALQEMKTWKTMIHTDKVRRKANDAELYFEETDFDGFLALLEDFPDVQRLHDVEEQTWGQRVIRIYDPDFHVIEVGESMDFVIRRMLKSGMSVEETARNSQYPIEYVVKLK